MSQILGKNFKVYYTTTTPTADSDNYLVIPATSGSWTLAEGWVGCSLAVEETEDEVTGAEAEDEEYVTIFRKTTATITVLADLSDTLCSLLLQANANETPVPLFMLAAEAGSTKNWGFGGYWKVKLGVDLDIKKVMRFPFELKSTRYRLNDAYVRMHQYLVGLSS